MQTRTICISTFPFDAVKSVRHLPGVRVAWCRASGRAGIVENHSLLSGTAMSFVIPAPDQASLPVAGWQRRSIPGAPYLCIGRNYADHAREMGGSPDREPPFFFCKAGRCRLCRAGRGAGRLAVSDDHHRPASRNRTGGCHRSWRAAILMVSALQHAWGYGVGLDMTRRDLQGR